MCSGSVGYSGERTVLAGTHHVLPVSGLRVFQCPEGVSSVPHRGPVLVPGTMLGHGSEYLRSSKVTWDYTFNMDRSAGMKHKSDNLTL